MKTRIVQTRFWEDSFVSKLKPLHRYLFLYLITNIRVELTGAYEVPISLISAETGLSVKEIEDGFTALWPKICYSHGYVVIVNHKRYQDFSKGNENQRKAYTREFDKLPDHVRCLFDEDLELVANQLTTSCQLDLNKNTEIRNKNTEIRNKNTEIRNKNTEIRNKDETLLQEVVQFYNLTFGKNTTSTRGFEDNFSHWLVIHDIDKIKKAITNARKDTYWRKIMTLQILFRKKNPRGEAVDYIEELANRDPGLQTGKIAII